MGRSGVRFLEEGREWRLPYLLYADDLVLCGESEKDLRVMLGWFVEVCRRSRLKVNAGQIKVMVMKGVEGLECDVYVDGIYLEHVSEYKYLGCVLGDGAECSRKMVSRRRVADPIRSLVNARICSFSVLESCIKHCLYLFLHMAVKQFYGRRSRDLGLGLYRWTTLEACLVLGG